MCDKCDTAWLQRMPHEQSEARMQDRRPRNSIYRTRPWRRFYARTRSRPHRRRLSSSPRRTRRVSRESPHHRFLHRIFPRWNQRDVPVPVDVRCQSHFGKYAFQESRIKRECGSIFSPTAIFARLPIVISCSHRSIVPI
jgi:hypothetical protein